MEEPSIGTLDCQGARLSMCALTAAHEMVSEKGVKAITLRVPSRQLDFLAGRPVTQVVTEFGTLEVLLSEVEDPALLGAGDQVLVGILKLGDA